MGRGAGRDGGGAADDAGDPSRRGASESAGVGRVGGGVGEGGQVRLRWRRSRAAASRRSKALRRAPRPPPGDPRN